MSAAAICSQPWSAKRSEGERGVLLALGTRGGLGKIWGRSAPGLLRWVSRLLPCSEETTRELCQMRSALDTATPVCTFKRASTREVMGSAMSPDHDRGVQTYARRN